MLGKLMLSFFKNIGFIFTIVFVFCLLVPIILKYRKRVNQKKDKILLTSTNIILHSKILSRVILSLFMSLFLLVGLFLIIYADTLEAKLFGGLLTLLYFIVTIKPCIQIIKVLSGNYVIKLDKLIDKEISQKEFQDDNGHSITTFYLLKFEKYKKDVQVDRKTYDSNIGDEFYLVFLKNEKQPIGVYSLKEWDVNNYGGVYR